VVDVTTTSADDSPAPDGAGPPACEPTGPGQSTYVRQQPGRGPALIFLGLIAVIALGGITLALLSSNSTPPPATLGTLKGSTIAASSAAKFLSKIAVSGEPPANVSGALVVPAGATLSSFQKVTENLELFAGSVTVASADQPSAVVTFYRLELAHEGWKVTRTDATATGKGTEVFATIAGSDGFYWEVEVIVESTNPSVSPALGGGDASATSSVSLQLVELNDED
jgi:hypothetical protein